MAIVATMLGILRKWITRPFISPSAVPTDAAEPSGLLTLMRGYQNGGVFIFDLNTRAGLLRWNNISVDDSEEAMIVTRGYYSGQGSRATVADLSGPRLMTRLAIAWEWT